MSIESWLTGLDGYASLGPQAGRVVKVLAREPGFAAYAAAREVAERAGVNVSTVVRTAQQLGFDGWPGLRQDLRDCYIDSLSAGGLGTGPATDPAVQMLRRDAANVAALMEPVTTEAIRAVAGVMASARRTVIAGSGSAAGPAHVLAYPGMAMGYDIQLALGAATVQAAQVTHLGKGDCLLVINMWRLTRAQLALTRLAHEAGVTVCVLTELRSTPLADHADHVIVVPTEAVRGLTSVTAMVSAVQAIVAELAEPAAVRAFSRVERAWHDMNLIEDQN
ncbi:MurR/RpiR family transcriptional regulator [Streptomyces sp. SYSU K217416]